MTKRILFGTDGIRGQANFYPITVEVMLALGKALGFWVKQNPKNKRGLVVIGKDTRLSGYALEQALSAGLCSMGADVRLLGPLPTPAIAHLTTALQADVGLMISASHNPYEDNGVKIFGPDGFKLPDSKELELEQLIFHPSFETTSQIGKVKRINDAAIQYMDYLLSLANPDFHLKGLKIVLDCANGAAYKVAPRLLHELGAELIILGASPNGTNINHEIGALHPQFARKIVQDTGANLGIVLDGDADRVVLIDETGQVIPGDTLLALVALYLQTEGRLTHNTVVCTEMSNFGLEQSLHQHGISVERTAVGDRYVVERMRQKGYAFGGEESGHLIFLGHGTTGDGLAGALLALNLLQEKKQTLSELKTLLKLMPRSIQNRLVPAKPPLSELPKSSALIAKITHELGARGRILVRYSGTEKKLRVLVEGPDLSSIEAMAQAVADSVIQEIEEQLN
ncbi:MAG: phosphoglucosamine mutase [Myxococcaceae bacterium]|nr:phosphoglucosamine mutase [Myxococcaceae bacterium]